MSDKTLIIIPAYNESETILKVVSSILSFNDSYDIVVINDGSIDDTSEQARKCEEIEVIDLPFNLGIGGSVQTGFIYAFENDYDIALQFDGDGQHLVSELTKIIDPVKKGEVDCMIGSRFVQDLENYRPTSLRMLGIRLLRGLSYIFTGQHISDQTSGFRAYNKKCIEYLAGQYPDHYPEPELILLLAKNGFKISEVFTQMTERQGGVSSIPIWKGPYYIIRVTLALLMAQLRYRNNKENNYGIN